ncbi:YbfB/YjiJ family MFS transporter [Salipiger marinus]|uniref:YbfB/YjiJ family MFS transporter n=1 Tax=Salipiger marinus TaxID=555512 RepID=UPI004059A12A
MRRDSLAILALAVTPAICLGIARFAHALLLPEMREDLGWTYAEAGWLNTSNGAGYLAGALMCAPAIARAGPSALCGWTLGLRVRAWALRGNPGDSNPERCARTCRAGRRSCLLRGQCPVHADRTTALGSWRLFYAGPGLGIVFSGLAVPVALKVFGQGSWSIA